MCSLLELEIYVSSYDGCIILYLYRIIIIYVYIIFAGVSVKYILILYVSIGNHKSSRREYIFIHLYIIHNPWYIQYPICILSYPSVKEYLTHPSMFIYVSSELFRDTSCLCWIIVRN